MPALNSSGTARKGRITIFRAFAGLFTILFLTAASMPILDYTQRETLAYMKEPIAEPRQAPRQAERGSEKALAICRAAGTSRRGVCDSDLSRLSEKNKSAGLKPCYKIYFSR